jgi:IPT/TIG domain
MPKSKATSSTGKAIAKPAKFDVTKLGEIAKSPRKLKDWLETNLPWLVGPSISSYSPGSGQRGTIVTINGSQFAPGRFDNSVTIGGTPAFVLSANANEIKALVTEDTDSGSINVTVGTHTAATATDFIVTGYPVAGSGEDGPPIVATGVGDGASAGDVNPIGTIRVLVVMLNATDQVPANPTAVRNGVVTRWNNVRTYYQQASYNRTDVQFDVTNFAPLNSVLSTFVDPNPPTQNIIPDQLVRITAIGAQAAQSQGFTLNNYQMICCVVFTNGAFVRAWGDRESSHFLYDNKLPVGNPNRVKIDISTNHAIKLLWINESADWGRFAHEFGHNVVSAPTASGDGSATLREDVYGSDLVDPSAATAQDFELMGKHDSHPLFTGYHLEKLGYYNAPNIRTLNWDRNPNSQTIDIVAHGLSEDGDPNRVHIVKVKVSDALTYYVEVRQRPGRTTQVFDDSIPFGASTNQGGVIVTRVIAGEMHNNQQTRFISLMHENRVLLQGEFCEDPARALRITVENDSIQAWPLVCRVKVEWAQTVVNDPNGAFDINVTPWDSSYQSPDIWIDRDPFGSFDNATDPQGRPIGNGDRPKVAALNHFASRVHVSGAMGATNVKLTYYAISPPGVGDNGNWAPIAVKNIPTIPQNGFIDDFVNWVPVVGQHTCLKVFASAQFGEISGQNNGAQENVFDFIAAGSSPCDPVFVRTAIRNPLKERRAVHLSIKGLPSGWRAQIPHSWIWLDGLAEKHVDIVIWPTEDIVAYKFGKHKKERGELPGMAPVRISGHVPRDYEEILLPAKEQPGSRFYSIGGTFYRVHVRRKSSLRIEAGNEGKRGLFVVGNVSPPTPDQQVVIEMFEPGGKPAFQHAIGTQPDGSFRDLIDFRSVLKVFGSGVYSVKASIFDATDLDDAESNVIQVQF